MTDFIVKSAVCDALEGNNVSADFFDEFNDEVAELLEDASRRPETNDHRTVHARDL